MTTADPATGPTEPPAARGAGERLPRPFGKFVLVRKLARGGMADVYLASLSGAQGFEKELVVKLIRQELAADEAFVNRFVDEAKTCVRLTHPNIVSIFELGVETGVLYLAMELVRGATLAEVLAEGGALRPDEGAYVALEVARALHHAHRRGVVHRDVTPGNVMIDDEGVVKLLDFGIAAPAGGLDVEVFGTPGHMPPEQIEGGALTAAADLFALGTVVLEAWTGRAPFRRADVLASKTALHVPPPPPSSAHAELAPLDGLMASMLALDPAQRPQHADDVARVLRAHLRERNLDLDEVARQLAGRVRRAASAREDREAGRATAAPPMAKAMRPTPLGDASRTFATRGEIATWSGPATRRLEGDEAEASRSSEVAAVPASAGTRRLDEPAAPSAPPVAAPRRARWLVALLAVAAVGGLATWRARTAVVPAPPPSTSASVVAPTSASTNGGASPAQSGSSPSVAVASASHPEPSTSASASGSAAATTGVGRLVVTSSPPAAVELDGRAIGRTPVIVAAAPGDHRLVLRPVGLGESFERRITVAPAGGVDVHGDFNDEPVIRIRRTPAAPK